MLVERFWGWDVPQLAIYWAYRREIRPIQRIGVMRDTSFARLGLEHRTRSHQVAGANKSV